MKKIFTLSLFLYAAFLHGYSQEAENNIIKLNRRNTPSEISKKSSKGIVVELDSSITDTLMSPPRKRFWAKESKVLEWITGVNRKYYPCIINDYVDDKGDRVISCNPHTFASPYSRKEKRPILRLSVLAQVSGKDTLYHLCLSVIRISENSSFSLSIKEGDVLLFKNIDNEIVKLNAEYSKKDIIGSPFTYDNITIYSYEVTTSYLISETDLRKMLKGITKVRVVYNMETYDLEIPDFILTDFLRLEYGLIFQELRKERTIYDGF